MQHFEWEENKTSKKGFQGLKPKMQKTQVIQEGKKCIAHIQG